MGKRGGLMVGLWESCFDNSLEGIEFFINIESGEVSNAEVLGGSILVKAN